MKKILTQFILLISFLSISQITQGCNLGDPGNMIVDGKYYFKTQVAVRVYGVVPPGATWNISNVTGGDIYLLPSTIPQATPINMPETSSVSPFTYSLDFWVLSGETIAIEATSSDWPGVILSTTVGGCTAVSPPTVIIETNELCPGDDLMLMETGIGGTQWEWTGPDGFSSDKQNPTISNPTNANTGDYTVNVSNEGGATTETLYIEIPEAFSFDFDNATQTQTGTGMNVYAIEVCGGEAPYSINFNATGGFANSNLLLSSNTGCQTLQITYANGVDWTATVTDANDCSNESSIINSDDLGGTPLLIIDGFSVVKETGIGALDGELTVNILGGDDSCNDYSYDWSGPNTTINNTGGTTGNTLIGIGSGLYSVTVTDCLGNTVAGSNFVGRSSGRGRGRKTALNVSINSALQLYPNPAADFVQINYTSQETEETIIAINDLAGRTLWAQSVNPNDDELEIPLNNFENGLYIVTLRAENELIDRQKLLVVK